MKQGNSGKLVESNKDSFVVLIIMGLFFLGNFAFARFSNFLLILGLIMFICIGLLTKLNKTNLYMSLVLNGLIFAYTIFSPYKEYVFGSLMIYLSINMLFLLVIKDIKINEKIFKLANILMFIILIIGILITIGNGRVINFLADNYFVFSNKQYQIVDELKPIIFYDLHSLAGFFLFIFSFLNIEYYRKRKSKLSLISAIGFIYLLVKLRSNTAIYLIILIGIYVLFKIVYDLYKEEKLTVKMISGIVAVGCILTGILGLMFSSRISVILGQEGNGLSGRYSEGGVLEKNIEYIKSNPLRGCGVTYTKDLYWGDSGIVENMTRVSVVGAIIYYLMLFLFIKENVKDKSYKYYLFLILVLLESGMSLLFYFRTQLVLPLVVIYLNSLDDKKIIV